MLNEKAVSRKQQRFFGMVRAAQKGEMENPPPEISKVAATTSMSSVKKFAKTKHKGLPEKKKIEEEIKTNRRISFPEMQKRIRDAEERRRNQKKESEKLYIDIKRKGIKFYDKKGTGRIKKGKKVYD